MPSARKILILSLKRPRLGRGRRGRSSELPSPTYLALLVALLRILGFKFATVSQALTAPFGRFVCLTFDGATPDLAGAILPVLSKRQVPATVFVSTRGTAAMKHLPPLRAAGWEIGCLGHGLVDLTTQGYLEQRRLIAKAKTLLGTKLGLKASVFAYPFGAYDATTVSCLKDEGFTAAVTLRGGVNDETVEPHHLRRLPLGGALLTDLRQIARIFLEARRAEALAPRAVGEDAVRQTAAL